ncbi:LptA/OstA family protein [Phenylobacterium immobile]|uniref:LptA/OstA family protein n=1 Tax=Phenylobacterium immobile TaxID=21 RepID=UPI000B11C203|nr:LptA/OstA family protein [Phenylobacterium immobile]
MKTLLNLAALTLFAAAAPGLAMAQIAPSSNAPVDITADELEVVNGDCSAIWRGNAEALQDTSRLRADVLRIYNKKGPAKAGGQASCGAMDRMEAEGSVYYVSPQQRVRSNAATYQAASETITMTGDVVAAQGQNVLRGSRMTINTETGKGVMQSDVKGRNKPGRVRGVFYFKDQSQQTKPAAQ